MLSIITLKVGSMQTNSYLVFDKLKKYTLIIDPGGDSEYIKDTINQNKLIPKMIIVTHGHFDHILSAFDLQVTYKIRFAISPEDEFLLLKMKTNCQYYLNIKCDPPPIVNIRLKEKDRIYIGKSFFQVIKTKGHTPGSVCLYFPREQWFFTGDTYFSPFIFGRTDFSYSSKIDLLKSLKKIQKYLTKSKIFAGH